MHPSRRPSLCIVHFALCIALSLATASATADEFTLRIPISVTGYAGSDALTDFPVLVRLAAGSPSGFSYDDCALDGSDIRFVDANGDPLSFEIDTWNPQGESCIWVKLPSMEQGTAFEMRYGGSPLSANSPADTWTAYGGVWHMNENAATQTDRTGNGLDATMASGVTYALADGPVGTSVSKSGILQTANFFASDQPYAVPTAGYTVSGWYWWPEYPAKGNANPLQKGVWGQDGWYLQHNTSNAQYSPYRQRLVIVYKNTIAGPVTVKDCNTDWNYLTVTYDGTYHKVYVNGSSTAAYSAKKTFAQGSYPFVIGSYAGLADETRVMRSAASPDYVAADYAAQTNGLLTCGAATPIAEPILTLPPPEPQYVAATISARLSTAGGGASSATVSFAYGTDAENLPAPSVIANGLAAGQTATANLTGLADNTTYHYVFTSVNDASPAQSYTMTGSFTTRAFGSPEIAVRATPGLQTSTIAVTVKTPGIGVPTCDVYVATGDDPANLGPEELIGDDVGIGAVATKSIASPTTPYLTYYAVRVVNGEGKTTTASGSLDTEIKWYFDSKNKRLTNAVGWKIAASKTTVKGVEGYSIDGADAIQAAPKDGNGNYLTELDLTGLKDTGLDIVSLGGHIFRNNGGLKISLTKLHLPDTIIQINSETFSSTSTIRDFEPHEFPDLVAVDGRYNIPTAIFANPVLSFPNPGYKTYVGQSWYASGAKKIYFGYGLTAFGNYAFDSSGATDLYLTGDAVPTTGTDWHRGTGVIRVNVPIYSDEWKAYAAKSAADPTTAQMTTYASSFPDGRALWKVGTSGGYSGLYLCKWAPDDYCRNALHVRGNIPAGEPSPAYGKHKYVPQSVAVSAPAAATYENVAYVCAGYILEALGDDGWGAPVTNRNVNAFTLARDDETSYRVTWLWEVAGFTLTLNTTPPSGLTYGELSLSPAAGAAGTHAPGTVVTITAPATGNGDWADAVFDHWEGDVPPGNEKANPLVVTMDQARSLTPVYAANWRAVDGYATTRITDGYFTLKCTTTGNEISLGNSCGLVIGGVDVLDLRKPVADGRVITALTGYTFSPNAGSQMYPFDTIVFPDTLKQVGGANLGGGTFGHTGVKKMVNTFPDCLESISAMHGTDSNWEGGPVYLLNKKLTAIPGQIFGGYSGNHAYHLGVNIASIPNYAFDANSGRGVLSVYLYGERKPTFGGGDWHRGASPVRVVVPRSSAEWKAWLAANTTIPTSAQTNTYNTTFADREPGEKLIGIGKNVDYQNGVYFCTWPSPAAAGGTILFLR